MSEFDRVDSLDIAISESLLQKATEEQSNTAYTGLQCSLGPSCISGTCQCTY